jgi:two-component system CheB/CheR fusion protein
VENKFTVRGLRLPIDFFFQSLAQDQHERAIGIILSGTGSDGTLGARAIKAEGGIIMAQNTESTEFDGMPRSIIATGLVDYVMPPAEMPAQLIAYVNHAFTKRPQLISAPVPPEAILKKIFILLRGQTGHDFSLYKSKTVYRRIERRMAVQQIDTLDLYLKFLQQNPAEINALFADLLIGVTNFFRDPDAFQTLEKQVIPRLFTDRPANSVIRIWSPGCSTGEEAYSIAILQEYMELIKQSYKVQIFATDIDRQAIATARSGLYPVNIAVDISPERLSRFFTAESDSNGYRIHKSIRDMLVFSEHNVIKDPPFSKLDLISCRNLLIYLTGELQQKLIPLFHYALNPGGTLFLGSSESVGEFDDIFIVLDRKAKLYKRKEYVYDKQHKHIGAFLPPMTAINKLPLLPANKTDSSVKLSLRELTEQTLLQQVAPASVLVNSHGDILYLHGRTGMYLEPAPGESGINNILKMAREGLRRDLTTSLHKAARTTETVYCPGLRVKTNGHFTLVNLTIRPVTISPATAHLSSLYLVILEEAQDTQKMQDTQGTQETQKTQDTSETDVDPRIVALNQELRLKDDYMQAFQEELETSNEELKCSNEEMQSVNEELQSTNEELETSKEELQSVNEELATVNTELQTKLTDLSRANNDMNNLLAGTGIATIFLDLQLRILRFTPTACEIMDLITSDIGRPVSHLALNLIGYDRLVKDTHGVLNTLIPKEVDVQTSDNKWFAMRIQPYRTLDNIIEGVVITFVEITEIVRAREALRRMAIVVRDAHDAITVQDLNVHIIAWNPGAVRLYGWSEAEALKMNVRDLIPAELQEQALARVQQLSEAEILEPFYTKRITRTGNIIDVWVTATALVNETGKMYAIATTARAIESKNAQLMETPNGEQG